MSTVTQPKPKQKAIPRKRTDIPRMRDAIADVVDARHVGESLQEWDEDLEIAAEVAQLRAEREESERQVTLIPLVNLQRHPHNRTIDPADPSIEELAESLKANGQLEPMRVRQLSKDRYQLISGERRYTAMKLAGINTARCLVVNIDDATALREVAVANSNREDLNPIQRAELMQQLMLPKSKGGSELSLLAAGKLFGLNSESGCKNALRILKLPEKIRDWVANREIPERAARALIPYSTSQAVMSQLVKELEDDLEGTLYELSQDGGQPWWLRQAIEKHLRPISPEVKRHYGWDKGSFGCLFDWQAHEAQLQIIELPFQEGRKSTQAKFAQNIKLWDKLNDPFVKEAIANHRKEQDKKSSPSKSSTKPKALTPSEEKAEAKRKAKEQDEQLDRYTKEWACRFLRCSIAEHSHDDTLVALTLPWLVGECASHDLRRLHHQALIECRVIQKKASRNGWGQLDTLSPLLSVSQTSSEAALKVMGTFWRIILWPVSISVGELKSELTPAGTLPDKLCATVSLDSLKQLATLAGLSIESAWKGGTVDDSDERRLISAWLMRHTKAQLQALTIEIPTGSIAPAVWDKRDQLAGHILAAHKPGKPLPVPKRLQKLFK